MVNKELVFDLDLYLCESVEVRIRKMGRRLDVPKVHPHKFRRTLATMAIDKGIPVEQVLRLLGHVRIKSFQELFLSVQVSSEIVPAVSGQSEIVPSVPGFFESVDTYASLKPAQT